MASPQLKPRLQEIREQVGCSAEICYLEEEIYTCLSRCDLVMTTTGTSTLEAALLGVPMVAAYRLHPISVWLGRMFASTRYVAMPNLLVDEYVVDRRNAGLVVYPESSGGVALRIEVDNECPISQFSETCAEVDGGRCFAHTALLVRDSDHTGKWATRTRFTNRNATVSVGPWQPPTAP